LRNLLSRATKYVANMPPAVAGNHGHDAAFEVALALCHGFALPKEQAWPILRDYSQRCCPSWSDKELEHKLDDAANPRRHSKPRGYLLGARWPERITKVHQPEGESVVVSIDTSEPLPGEKRQQAGQSEAQASSPQESASLNPKGGAGPWLEHQMVLFRDHEQIETEEDARLLRGFLAIVHEESRSLALSVSDDEVRAAALALRKDLALGLIQTPRLAGIWCWRQSRCCARWTVSPGGRE
jgi:hypothetical protein